MVAVQKCYEQKMAFQLFVFCFAKNIALHLVLYILLCQMYALNTFLHQAKMFSNTIML